MGRVEDSIEINAPVKSVFALVSDLDRYPDFIPGVTEVVAMDEKKSQWKAEAMGIPVSWAAEFTKWSEDEEIAWESYDGVKNAGSWILQSMDEGGTKLTFVMEYELPNSMGFLGSFLDQGLLVGELEKRVGQGLRTIKELAEKE